MQVPSRINSEKERQAAAVGSRRLRRLTRRFFSRLSFAARRSVRRCSRDVPLVWPLGMAVECGRRCIVCCIVYWQAQFVDMVALYFCRGSGSCIASPMILNKI